MPPRRTSPGPSNHRHRHPPGSRRRVPLLVVPLAAGDIASLTLAEWDALVSRRTVWFEVADHPLSRRLAEAGVQIATGSDAPSSDSADRGAVLDPRSPHLVRYAKAGADVTSGVASAPDALSASHGAYIARSGAASLGRLAVVMARLRSADGCPWDREQTHASLRTHLLEETYEVLDAIDAGDLGSELEE